MRANGIYIGIDPGLNASSGPGGSGLSEPGGPGPGGTDAGDAVAVSDEALRAAVAQVTELLRDHIDVPFEVVDGRSVNNDASFAGGEAMSTCTAGFAARERNGGRYGIITAGHCPDSQSMHGVSLPYVRGGSGARADAQFHTIPTGSSHQLLDDYLCISGFCDVQDTEPRDRMIGDMVCHTGKNSGISCGMVIDISYRPTYDMACHDSYVTPPYITPGRCDSVFVKVEHPDLRSCPGDSGDPWYARAYNGLYSSYVYGIHKGSSSDDGDCDAEINHAFFSAIIEVQDYLRVDVLSSGPVTIS